MNNDPPTSTEPPLWTSRELDPDPLPSPTPRRSPWPRRLLVLVLAAVWIVVLFTLIFPRLEELIQDPSIDDETSLTEDPAVG